MKLAKQATYLGDVICETGTLDGTIKERCQRAVGIITQISSILSSVHLGNFHFDIAMVLREAQFINSIMTNSDVWHNVQLHHKQSLEQKDLELLRKILNAHSKTAAEAFYFELGKYPLRFVWSKRRLMYLWHVLHRDRDELIRKIYEMQKLDHNKGDWFESIQQDRAEFDIGETDQEISGMSQEKFRNVIEKKIQTAAIEYLKGMAVKHSKSEKLVTDKFEKKSYFTDRRFSKEDVQLLFALKTKMIDCKSNFSNQYDNNLVCRVCKDINTVENEEHL